jgi:hypothetical protein
MPRSAASPALTEPTLGVSNWTLIAVPAATLGSGVGVAASVASSLGFSSAFAPGGRVARSRSVLSWPSASAC